MRVSRMTGAMSLVMVGAVAALSGANPAVDPGVAWAYPRAPKGAFPQVPPGTYRVDGSALVRTADQLNGDEFRDWLPESHPPMPSVVARSRGQRYACADCHLITGQGFIGTPNLSSLPENYIIQQVREFRSGRRTSSETGRQATDEMIMQARQVSDAELAEAAHYFSSLPQQRWIRVVESDTAPATSQNYYGWNELVPNGGVRPLQGEIVEVAEDFVRMMVGDPKYGLVAYVPKGSLRRGEEATRRPNALGQTCLLCHGNDFAGTPLAPPLCGRSPSYLARALWDMKSGARSGPAVALMQAPVAALTPADITALSAYLASLPPRQGPPPAFVAADADPKR